GSVNITIWNAAPVAGDDPLFQEGISVTDNGLEVDRHDSQYVIPSYATGKTVRLGGPDLPGGLLVNDHDDDGDPLQVVLVQGPATGRLTLEADGAFTYLPDPGFIGSDSFTYKVTDGFLESNVATVKLLVANPPQIRRLTLVGTGASQVHRSNVKWIEVEFENF